MIEFTYSVCDLTQCPEKYICLHKECTPDKYCYECLNKKHLGKNNVLNHLQEFIEIDKFMQQVVSKIRKMEQFYNQMINQCQVIYKDNIQQICMAQNSERSKIVIKKLEKDVLEFIESLENEKQQLLDLNKYSKEEHEKLKTIYFCNEEIEMKKIQDKQNQLQQSVEKIIESLYLDTELHLLRLEEKTKVLLFQNKKSKFFQQIYFVCVLILTIGLLYQQTQIDQIKKQLFKQKEEFIEENSKSLMFMEQLIVDIQNSQKIFQDEMNGNFRNFSSEIAIQQEKIKNKIIQLEAAQLQKESLSIKSLIGEIHVKLNVDALSKFTVIYDNAFTMPFHTIQKQKLQQIFKGADPVICIGGVHQSNLNLLLLAGCDYASEVFQVTNQHDRARKSQNGGIYWYWVENYSFGFSPHMRITLNKSDNFDIDVDSCQTRFSYLLNDQWTGGGRIGSICDLKQSVDYRMRIYMHQP